MIARAEANRRIEIASTGIDEAMQVMGSDPFGSRSHVGLRVPFLPTAAVASANGGPQWKNRYLFLACVYSVGDGQIGRVRGWRQLQTIGVELPVVSGQDTVGKRVVEQLVTSPFWHFADGDISVHLTKMGAPNFQGLAFNSPPPVPVPAGTAFRSSMSPGLLWEAITLPAANPFYTELTAYKPANAGQPYGQPMNDHLQKSITDQRTQWLTHGAWDSLDLVTEGPATIAGWISVAQTDPESPLRPIPSASFPGTFLPGGLSPEEQFIRNFPGAQYYRAGLSLIVEIGERTGRLYSIPTGRKESA